MTEPHSGWPTQFRSGVTHGVIVATLFSAYVLLNAALGGRAHIELGVPLGTMVAIYFGGGIAAGLTYGALAPLTKWVLGRPVVGFLMMFPVGMGIMLVLPDAGLDDKGDWVVVVVFAALLGGLGGLHFLEPNAEDTASAGQPTSTGGDATIGPVVRLLALLTVLIAILEWLAPR